jgi:cysteine desulfurase
MIYADYNGTAGLHPEVVKYLKDRLVHGPYANPNAIHGLGKKVLHSFEKCRNICADFLGADKDDLFFNSGSSESISTVFHSVLGLKPQGVKNIIVISAIEHAAIFNVAKAYTHLGYELKILPVNSYGQVEISIFAQWLETFGKKIALVSVMAANNETGVIQPLLKIVEFCKKFNLICFSDTTQWVGKMPFDFNQSGLDYACLSGHKLGALTGTGILLSKRWRTDRPLIFGGGQEKSLRGGTQNYLGVESLAVAIDYIQNHVMNKNLADIKNQFEIKLWQSYRDILIFGKEVPRLANTTMLALPGIHGQAVQIELESQDIFVTTSSACGDNDPSTSNVLKAMGIDDSIGRGAVRISVNPWMKDEEMASTYEEIFRSLCKSFQKLSRISHFTMENKTMELKH